jgi:3-deoxy-D-manno-octulosonate 8-phosphate phosphatase (KDO 8-P phosphatase)
VSEYHERIKDKRACLEEIQQRLGVAPSETLVMGDDLPDLCQLGAVAVFAAPSNAVTEVRQRAQIVTKAAGGRGAVRELAEALLRARGEWDGIVERSLR